MLIFNMLEEVKKNCQIENRKNMHSQLVIWHHSLPHKSQWQSLANMSMKAIQSINFNAPIGSLLELKVFFSLL